MNKPKSMDDLPFVFGPQELAAILSISKNNAYDLVNRQSFPSTKVGRKHIISKTHFIQWLDKEIAKKSQEAVAPLTPIGSLLYHGDTSILDLDK